nr:MULTISPECIES: DEAD/DEAH box helicase family protein [unclassified Streptomyces]
MSRTGRVDPRETAQQEAIEAVLRALDSRARSLVPERGLRTQVIMATGSGKTQVAARSARAAADAGGDCVGLVGCSHAARPTVKSRHDHRLPHLTILNWPTDAAGWRCRGRRRRCSGRPARRRPG